MTTNTSNNKSNKARNQNTDRTKAPPLAGPQTKTGANAQPNTPANNGSNTPANTQTIMIIAVAIVAALAVIAYVSTQSKSKRSVSQTPTAESVSPSGLAPAAATETETMPVVVVGSVLSGLPESGADPMLGTPAPTVSGQSFGGAPLSLGGTSGPQVIVFVAHWCPHCQREVPQLARWATGGTRSGVAVRAVATATTKDRPNYPPSAWLEKEGWTIPTLADDDKSSAATAFGLPAFPYFVAINGAGNVALRMSGELSEAEFDRLITAAKT